MSFKKRYSQLNASQKKAVDTIEGPVMVIAGPGTGKTELLSVRVANILDKTDVNPSNILCLTFTDSGANAMRERLTGLIGASAYKVAIHTFHSFGSDIINRYPDYFYQGAHFRAADELDSFELMHELFEKLPHDNPLASRMNGEYTQLKNIKNTISDFKKSGLTPDELQRIIEHNETFIDFAEPILAEVFASTISKKQLSAYATASENIHAYLSEDETVPGITSLATICSEELSQAATSARDIDKTTPITAWKNKWLERDANKNIVFKDRARNKKLLAATQLYFSYLSAMQERELFDYDDMILRLVHALEVFTDLKLNLQEQYQYIMVDEYQDTNGAQVRILLNLTDNEVHDGRPNIMAVGDDDQAIFSFQGAEISNVMTFIDSYSDTLLITLTDNYRSAPTILEHARKAILIGEDRLENRIESLDKQLQAHREDTNSSLTIAELPTQADHNYWIASEIKNRSNSSSSIAVLARNHRDIKDLLPYLSAQGISVHYEHQENILDAPLIRLLTQLSTVVTAISEQRLDEANAALPELLAHPAWGIPTSTLWEVSTTAYREKKTWLEVMLESPSLAQLAQWLITKAYDSSVQPLEQMIDELLGSTSSTVQFNEKESIFSSPIKEYFFPESSLSQNSLDYVDHLEALRCIRSKLRDYAPQSRLFLHDFSRYIATHNKANLAINITRDTITEDIPIVLMTAHKAKGLEFDSVFIINATHSIWGSGARKRQSRLSYPGNLALAPAGESDDERLRLLYVAMTRAKRELIISYSTATTSNRSDLRVSALEQFSDEIVKIKATVTRSERIEIAEQSWRSLVATPEKSMHDLLKKELAHYQLSATHINTFTDVHSGGPKEYLLRHLLRFPSSISPDAAFGSAIHKSLQRAHSHLYTNKQRRPVEDILHDFEVSLKNHRLSTTDHSKYLQKGSVVLQNYFNKRYDSFLESDISERNFKHQGVVINGVRLSGVIDLMSVDSNAKTIVVTDYKTGSPAASWSGKSEYEKMKLHKYRQQLLLYKLLIENSQQYQGYTVTEGVLEFVEPSNNTGDIARLSLHYQQDELSQFTSLITAIWSKIMNCEFEDTSQYDQSLAGITEFEDYLLNSVD